MPGRGCCSWLRCCRWHGVWRGVRLGDLRALRIRVLGCGRPRRARRFFVGPLQGLASLLRRWHLVEPLRRWSVPLLRAPRPRSCVSKQSWTRSAPQALVERRGRWGARWPARLTLGLVSRRFPSKQLLLLPLLVLVLQLLPHRDRPSMVTLFLNLNLLGKALLKFQVVLLLLSVQSLLLKLLLPSLRLHNVVAFVQPHPSDRVSCEFVVGHVVHARASELMPLPVLQLSL